MIEVLLPHIDPALMDISGKVFYSGRAAFSAPSDLYVLGFNPGGDPNLQADETIRSNVSYVMGTAPLDWSAYCDESWKGKAPGAHGIQPPVLHLFRELKLDPRTVPSSNLIFVRSTDIKSLPRGTDYEGLCWKFHAAVIAELRPRIILCLGKDTGRRVRNRLDAHSLIGSLTEANNREGVNEAHKNAAGLIVISLLHPSRGAWATDPSTLVKQMQQHIEKELRP